MTEETITKDAEGNIFLGDTKVAQIIEGELKMSPGRWRIKQDVLQFLGKMGEPVAENEEQEEEAPTPAPAPSKEESITRGNDVLAKIRQRRESLGGRNLEQEAEIKKKRQQDRENRELWKRQRQQAMEQENNPETEE